MPWYDKAETSPFENRPINGLFFLHGDVLAKRYHQEWLKSRNYPLINSPSDLNREIFGNGDSPLSSAINVFGAFWLPYTATRDEVYITAQALKAEHGHVITKRGKSDLITRCTVPE
jgi:hypothetical protein